MVKTDKIDPVDVVRDLGVEFSHFIGGEAYFYCPFHADRNPSFCVSVNSPVFWCHSCETGGHVGQLKGMLDGGKPVPKKKKAVSEKSESTIVIAKMSIDDYDALSPASDCKYFRESGISMDTVANWGIKRTAVFLVLPICDTKSNRIGLVLRSMLSSIGPRYQNSIGFRKKSNLFGSDHFVPLDFVIVVEGPFDCIKSHQNGFENTVAIFGSSIGDGQIKKLSKLSGNIFLLLDNDQSGIEATVKIAEKLVGFNVFVPDYRAYKSKDPGKCDCDELSNILSSPVPYLKAKLGGVFASAA